MGCDDPIKKEYRLLLQLRCKRKRLWVLRKKIIQGAPHHLQVTIKNLGSDFPGGQISNFYVGYKVAKLGDKYPNSKQIPAIKHGKSTKIRIGNLTPHHQGSVWFECSVHADDNMPIRIYHESGAQTESPNKWGDANFIQSKIETLQTRTNNLILFLTALIFIDGTVGLNEMFQYIKNLLNLN